MSWCTRCKTFHKLYAICPEEADGNGQLKFGAFKFDPPIFNISIRETPRVFVQPLPAPGCDEMPNDPGQRSA